MEIREAAQHRWHDILVSLGIDGKLLNQRHQACPICQAGKDRFRWTDHMGTGAYICNHCGHGDGFDLLMSITGKEFKDVAADVRGVIGETVARAPQNTDAEKTRRKLKQMWKTSLPLSKGDPVHRYLISRGLAGLRFAEILNLRYHPAQTHWTRDDNGQPVKGGTYPAMLGMVTTPDGQPATLHVTYLQPDGRKAEVDGVRKIMTPSRNWDGGAIRLDAMADKQVLCVAEGIETALAMKLDNPDWCAWACISAGMLEKFVPPDGCEAVYIAADNDSSFTGQAASFGLAKRLVNLLGKGRVSVLMPTKTDSDFLDQLNDSRTQAA